MKIIHGLDQLQNPFDRSILTIGNFDGVHLAHQQLLAQAGLFAANSKIPVVVLTFEPHPLTIVAPDKAPERLTPLPEKLRYLEAAGADVVVVAKSGPELFSLEAEQFVHEIVHKNFNPTHIVEGPSFGFGKGRRGTPQLLKQCAAEFGCEVYILESITLQIDEGETLMVSSSLIRKLIREGKVRRAALCLGRSYSICSTVMKGDGRGRTLGFPTANLQSPSQLIPGEGVYAGKVTVDQDQKVYPSAISIGKTPTFDGDELRIEAHLLDFSGDLYDRKIRVEFHHRLREQKKFDSPESLKKQLHLDIESVRNEL